jgi:hypothetical protein
VGSETTLGLGLSLIVIQGLLQLPGWSEFLSYGQILKDLSRSANPEVCKKSNYILRKSWYSILL